MNKYERMIIMLANDLDLEVNNKTKFNLSNEIKKGNKKLLDDIYLLNNLAFNIRHEKIKIVEVK